MRRETVALSMVTDACNPSGKIVAVLWCLWHRRNEKLWNGVEKPINICLQFAIQHVHDWKIAHWRNLTSSNQSFRNYSLWTKPPIDHMKCNVDTAIFHETPWFHGLPSSHEAEAITLLSEINWTSDMQFDNIIFEIDCKPVADSINSRRFQNTEVVVLQNYLISKAVEYSLSVGKSIKLLTAWLEHLDLLLVNTF
ncbi:hypothetical protein HKD37_03G006390 [Glycine soja]